MKRECVAIAILALTPACSLILDFDQKPPPDAGIYTQAQCDYMEPNDDVTAPPLIAATDMGPAAICKPAMGNPEDVDYYKLTVSSPTVTVGIMLMNRPGGDLDIKLLDAGGNMLSQSRGFGDSELITCPGLSPSCPALAAGDYILQVFPAVPGSVNSYTFSVAP
jgi:hypothetical protein